jgi:hypothetical protein
VDTRSQGPVRSTAVLRLIQHLGSCVPQRLRFK